MKTLSTALLLAVPTLALAVEPPVQFEDGDVISAESMNDNFEELYQAILDLEDQLADVGLDVDLNQSNLADLDSSVSSVNGSLSALRTDVDAAEDAIAQAVPPGTLAYFDMSSCPTGWSTQSNAEGRVLVAMPSGGALGGTVGSALGNQEDRTHRHSVNPAARTFTTSSAGSHNHQWLDDGFSHNSAGSRVGVNILPTGPGSSVVLRLTTSLDLYTDNDGAHSHGVSVDLPSTDSSSVSATMPYIQYVLCQRQ